MSGVKEFSLVAGAASTPTLAPLAPVILGTGAVIAAGVVVAMLGAKAFKAYEERRRKEEEEAKKREQEVQQQIVQIKKQVASNSAVSKVVVHLLTPTTSTPANITQLQQLSVEDKDVQRRIQEQKSRLPKINSEYQNLVDLQLLDAQTVNQALQKTEQALNANKLQEAEAHLRALDDARIQVIQHLRAQWVAQLQYVQQRLDNLRPSLPLAVVQDLQIKIDQARNNWQQLTDADLQALHQQISEFQAQVDRIQEAAQSLVNSWTEVGYVANIVGTDNGDAVIEVETHEGENTQMRFQFDGQQINLFGPPEESSSCAARTKEALQIFQEQGYYMGLTTWDGQPVPEELRQLYSAVITEESAAEEDIAEPTTNSDQQKLSQRRLEGQGY